MTSGKPYTRPELEFISANLHEKFPSIIARSLATIFWEYNGGYRSRDSVANIMARLSRGETIDNILAQEKPNGNGDKPRLDMRKGRPRKAQAKEK